MAHNPASKSRMSGVKGARRTQIESSEIGVWYPAPSLSPSPPACHSWPGGRCCAVSVHKAIISWKRTSPDFLKGKYSREHTWTFDGGITVAASPSPSVVPVPYSNPANVDPEEAFVAAVSSCHMLTYLHLASKQGFQIDS